MPNFVQLFDQCGIDPLVIENIESTHRGYNANRVRTCNGEIDSLCEELDILGDRRGQSSAPLETMMS
jgi:hypothetical protein